MATHLIKDNTWSDYVALIRRRWRPTFATAAVIALGTIFVAFSLPAVYQSSATILIEDQGIPTDYVQTTVDSYAEQRLQTIYQRVTAGPRVLEMVDEFGLYPDDRGRIPDEDLIDMFRDNTVMEPQNVMSVNARTGREAVITFGFTVSFLDSDPVKARDVAQSLADRFVAHNAELRAETAARTTAFLDNEAEKLQQELNAIRAEIADFKALHANNLPENQDVNQRMRERLRDDLVRVEEALNEKYEAKALLEAEIVDVPRYRPILGDGDPVLGGVDRLAEAQQELVRLRGRYSDNHPAIQNLEREIAALTGSPENRANLREVVETDLVRNRQLLAAARETYSDSHPDVIRLQRTVESLEQQLANLVSAGSAGAAPNNPTYLQLRTRIATAQASINDLSRRQADLIARIDELDRQQRAAPEVERQYAALEQRRSLLSEQLTELRNMEGTAALGEALETGQSGERLTIVENARVPSSPVSPNRVSLTFLGIVLAIAAGLGVASLTDAMDTKVRGRQDILKILEAPPMGIIPYVEDTGDTARRLSMNAAMGILTIAAIALVASAIIS